MSTKLWECNAVAIENQVAKQYFQLLPVTTGRNFAMILALSVSIQHFAKRWLSLIYSL
jgi:hypothetical protein